MVEVVLVVVVLSAIIVRRIVDIVKLSMRFCLHKGPQPILWVCVPFVYFFLFYSVIYILMSLMFLCKYILIACVLRCLYRFASLFSF